MENIKQLVENIINSWSVLFYGLHELINIFRSTLRFQLAMSQRSQVNSIQTS
jgi:hypothetical protein